MQFKKIHLNDTNGFKGAEVHFLEENARGVAELTKKYPKNPVHLSLEKCFKDLRVHLLQICGLINDDMDSNVAAAHLIETFVNCVELDGENIIISGEKCVFQDKYIKLKTCKLQEEDGYEHYGLVKSLVDTICEETEQYLLGTKEVEPKELIERWAKVNHKEDVFTAEAIQKLTPDQQLKNAIAIIEKGAGGIVMLPDDFKADDDAIMAVVEEGEVEISSDAIEIDLSNVGVKEEASVEPEEEEQF